MKALTVSYCFSAIVRNKFLSQKETRPVFDPAIIEPLTPSHAIAVKSLSKLIKATSG